jgi:3-oxoacyl-[acyl-carrier protein] reductase
MNLGLVDKKILISGSTRGIGLGIAECLLQEGANVMLTGSDSENSMETFLRLNKAYPGKVEYVWGDLLSPEVVLIIENTITKKWDSLDAIVANSGKVKPVTEWDISNLDWDWYLKQNFVASVDLVTRLVPKLKVSKGSIIFTGSIAGIEETGAPLPYSAAKAALTMYSKSLSRKLAPFKIRVNIVAPGNIIFPGGNWEKKMNADPEAIKKMLQENVPLNEFGTPEDIGSIVAFLLSRNAKFITGSCIVVDGGQTSLFN